MIAGKDLGCCYCNFLCYVIVWLYFVVYVVLGIVLTACDWLFTMCCLNYLLVSNAGLGL